MPELPEVEITARRLHEALKGVRVESVLAPGVKVMRTFDPPLSALEGRTIEGVRRRGKHLVVDFSGGLSLLSHLMSAGRLQLYDKRAGPRDRTSRLLIRVAGPVGAEPQERELRLREFGTKQAAWAKLLPSEGLDADEALAGLGPEAWPDPPALEALEDVPRPLNAWLRDQHVIAGVGRSWADEILWRAKLSPFKRRSDLTVEEGERLREAIVQSMDEAIAHYEEAVKLPIPDKLPMPLQVHHREGEPCPRCDTTLLAVHFEEHVIAYCPTCQTEGRELKDRRLSRLLK